jgi:3-oxoisoapionate kinase
VVSPTAPRPELLLAYYGDDFTGSTDALEALTLAGVPTVLFFQTPDAQALQRFPQARAVGLAGHARGRGPGWMREHLAPALQALAALGAPVLHYKVCSTFDSSPGIGSIGCAIDLGVPLMPARWSPMVVGVPRLGRYTAFGHLFAMGQAQGTGPRQGFRLDRHPTMSRHPVTPMAESDLAVHLGAQTDRRRALVDFTQLKRGDGDSAVQAAAAGDDTPVVLIDVLDDETLLEAGRLVWQHRAGGVFSASSSGLSYALAAHWQASGLLAGPALLPTAGPVPAIAVVSGSCSPATAGQIAWALDHGFAGHRLSPQSLWSDDAAAVAAAVDAACAALDAGACPLVYTARGPDDPAVQQFADHARAAGLSREDAALRTGQALARVMQGLLDRKPALRRVAVAGGDSSGEVAAALGVQALTMQARLAPGAPLCRAWSALPARDGLELVLKGGQVGEADFFGRVRDGLAS